MNTSKYILVDSKKLHFHFMGSGPAIVLLHPSPHTSEILLPIAKELATHYTVFCIDTPGYGKSDGLGFTPNSLNDYTEFLHKAFTKMNLDKPALYGSATGAQIAIRYALEYPKHVSHVFLDNAAHFDDDFCNAILNHYFPDLTPKIDGSHLTQIWQMANQMFKYFPWCFTTKTYALNRPETPTNILHFVAMDYIKAGANYDHAYKIAFKHERGYYVQQLQVPTTILRWNGSIITKYIDTLIAFDFPKHITSFSINGDANERMQLMTQFIKDKSQYFKPFKVDVDYKTYVDDRTLVYNKRSNDLPEISVDGSHLFSVWELLVQHNPELNAEQIQSCIIDCFTKH